MKKGGGRGKGSSFERYIAGRVVSAFKKFGIKKKDCYRTPMSGGHRQASKSDPGDLVLSKRLRELFPYSVECKFYKEINLWQFMQAEKKRDKSWPVTKWLEQTCTACGKKKKVFPLLVFRQNRSPHVLAALPLLMPVIGLIKGAKLRFKYEGKNWYVVDFEELLSVIAEERNVRQ